jgi:hypothetical protein
VSENELPGRGRALVAGVAWLALIRWEYRGLFPFFWSWGADLFKNDSMLSKGSITRLLENLGSAIASSGPANNT